MKVIYVMFALILLVSLSSFAYAEDRLPQGTWVVGASSGLDFSIGETKYDYDFGPSDTDSEFDVDLSAGAGYFFVKNLAVGPRLTFTYESDSRDESESRSAIFGIGFALRYYFAGESPLVPFVGIGIAKLKGSSYDKDIYEVEDEDGDSCETKEEKISITTSLDGESFALGGGLAYFLNKHISLNAVLDYVIINFDIQAKNSYDDSKADVDAKSESLNAGVGFSVYF
jgi:opacity protein-like surface antigen